MEVENKAFRKLKINSEIYCYEKSQILVHH